MFHFLLGGVLIALGLAWMLLAVFASMMSDVPDQGVDSSWAIGLVPIALGILAMFFW